MSRRLLLAAILATSAALGSALAVAVAPRPAHAGGGAPPPVLQGTIFDAGGDCRCSNGVTFSLVWTNSPTGGSWVSEPVQLCPASPVKVRFVLSPCGSVDPKGGSDCPTMQLGCAVEGVKGQGGNDANGPISKSPLHVQFKRPFDNVT